MDGSFGRFKIHFGSCCSFLHSLAFPRPQVWVRARLNYLVDMCAVGVKRVAALEPLSANVTYKRPLSSVFPLMYRHISLSLEHFLTVSTFELWLLVRPHVHFQAVNTLTADATVLAVVLLIGRVMLDFMRLQVCSGANCIKIGLPGKLILSKRKGLRGSPILLKILSENQFSGKTYFYTIDPWS